MKLTCNLKCIQCDITPRKDLQKHMEGEGNVGDICWIQAYIWWECVVVKRFWSMIIEQIYLTTKIKPVAYPQMDGSDNRLK